MASVSLMVLIPLGMIYAGTSSAGMALASIVSITIAGVLVELSQIRTKATAEG